MYWKCKALFLFDGHMKITLWTWLINAKIEWLQIWFDGIVKWRYFVSTKLVILEHLVGREIELELVVGVW